MKTWVCTYPTASNYDAEATVDAGDCVWTGCTDGNALNYNSIANLDDDSCNYQVCPDFNGDGEVQAQDLLDFLLAWGTYVLIRIADIDSIEQAAFSKGKRPVSFGSWLVCA